MADAGSRYRFKPAILPTLAAIALIGLFVALGVWQLNRAQEKRAMLQRYEALSQRAANPLRLPVADTARWRYRRVEVSGDFDGDRQFLLDNQISRGQAGYRVLTPLRLSKNQGWVLVDRGWVPLGASRSVLPDVSVADRHVTVEGIVYVPYGQGFSLGGMATGETGWPLRVQFIDFARLGARLAAPLAEMIIRLDPKSPYGYRRQWQTVPFGPARHVGYAVQWFALACAMLAIYLIVNFRRTEK